MCDERSAVASVVCISTNVFCAVVGTIVQVTRCKKYRGKCIAVEIAGFHEEA